MIKAVLIDDEHIATENLKILIDRNCPNVKVIGEASNVKDAVAIINKNKPDLVFLDINMPTGLGFLVLDLVEEIDFEVIFATAFDKFGVEAVKRNAIDYILKPISKSELVLAIQKVENKISQKSQQHTNKKLFLPLHNSIELIDYSNIVYIKSDSNYSVIFLEDGTSIIASKTLKQIEEIVNVQYFMRCHRSFLVNVSKIERYIKEDGGFLILKNKTSIPVSGGKKELVFKRLHII